MKINLLLWVRLVSRQFALNQKRLKNGMYEVLMFEPGTAEVLEIPCSFLEFHNEEVVIYNDACLASDFFSEWKNKKSVTLSHEECIGYKVPLFLGGDDALENMELSNIDVYWEVMINVIEKVRDFPEGTKVSFSN